MCVCMWSKGTTLPNKKKIGFSGGVGERGIHLQEKKSKNTKNRVSEAKTVETEERESKKRGSE